MLCTLFVFGWYMIKGHSSDDLSDSLPDTSYSNSQAPESGPISNQYVRLCKTMMMDECTLWLQGADY